MSTPPANELKLLQGSDPDKPIAIRIVSGEELSDIARALSMTQIELWERIDRNPDLRKAVARSYADRIQAFNALKLRIARQAMNVLTAIMAKTADEKIKARVAQLLLKVSDGDAIEWATLNRANELEARILERTSTIIIDK
jgi:CRP-like cAMP-binding protein